MLNRLFFCTLFVFNFTEFNLSPEVEAICAPLLFGRKLNGGV